jgi:hypothetical protein
MRDDQNKSKSTVFNFFALAINALFWPCYLKWGYEFLNELGPFLIWSLAILIAVVVLSCILFFKFKEFFTHLLYPETRNVAHACTKFCALGICLAQLGFVFITASYYLQ